ncbi:MAG: hypothetical protein GY821_12365 [Gammaproteobacteria bacterium]|nr:hypothetical protein [Gammaproteobacteria bacterium]
MQKNCLRNLLVHAVIFAVCFLTSCDTIASQKEVGKKYSNMNINQFIKERYSYDGKVIGSVDKYLDKASSMLGENKNRSIDDYTRKILKDGKSVIYPLSFNERNYRYLFKTRNEINEFCIAQHGTLFIHKVYNKNFSGLKESPTAEYFKAINSEMPDSLQTYDVFGNSYDIKVNKQMVASEASLKAILINQSSLSQIYQSAVKHFAFGQFICVSESNDVLWQVNVKPIAYKVESKYDHDLYVLISPIDKAVKNKLHQ